MASSYPRSFLCSVHHHSGFTTVCFTTVCFTTGQEGKILYWAKQVWKKDEDPAKKSCEKAASNKLTQSPPSLVLAPFFCHKRKARKMEGKQSSSELHLRKKLPFTSTLHCPLPFYCYSCIKLRIYLASWDAIEVQNQCELRSPSQNRLYKSSSNEHFGGKS